MQWNLRMAFPLLIWPLLFSHCFSTSFFIDFGSISFLKWMQNRSNIDPKSINNQSKIYPKSITNQSNIYQTSIPNRSNTSQKSSFFLMCFGCILDTFFDFLWVPFGTLLASFSVRGGRTTERLRCQILLGTPYVFLSFCVPRLAQISPK